MMQEDTLIAIFTTTICRKSVLLNLNGPEVPQVGREETSSLMTALPVNIAIYYPFGPLELRWDQPACSLDQILHCCIEKTLLEWQILKQNKQN